MSRKSEDNAAIAGIIIGLLSAIGLGIGLYNLFDNDWAAVIGVLLGFGVGILVYKVFK